MKYLCHLDWDTESLSLSTFWETAMKNKVLKLWASHYVNDFNNCTASLCQYWVPEIFQKKSDVHFSLDKN